jgi:isopentenyl-diphosphate Delta-isomerase
MELIDILDLRGNVVGVASRAEIYDRRLPHRIVHVMLQRADGKVFLQRRSTNVRYLPGHLCTSAGGHVKAGETPHQAALREVEEELELSGRPLELVDEFIFDDGHHRRIFLYRLHSAAPLHVSNREVDGGLFCGPEDLSSVRALPCHPQLWPCLERIFPTSTRRP